MNFPNQPYSNLRSKFPDLSKEGFDLLNKMLTFDPRRRITAQEALAHPFFQERPLPKDSFLMPTYPEMPKRANKRAPRAGDGRTSTISANSNNVKRNEDDQPKIVKSGGIDDTQFASDPGSYNRFNIAFG
jgi:cell division cycle 2-like protein